MAVSQATFTDIGGAASDLFAGFGDTAKAKGDFAEAQNYDAAAALATQNEKFTETSTAIKTSQADRENLLMVGGQKADVASAGFTEGGSALDLMRSSASQGALNHAVLGQQGLITEAGYDEQATTYKNMSDAATAAGNAANDASTFADISAGIKGIAAVASIVAAPATGGLSLAGLSALGA